MKRNLTDEKFMKMAVSLAKKAIGRTSPNPAVGAVLVKNGKIVASGYHKGSGSIHAEAAAIKKAGIKARGATLYGTLEACAHYGKTPPCVNAIIKSGVKRAVFGMRDPNPINNGRGIAKLKRAGIKTECGFLTKEISDLNRPFIKFMKKRLPYVTIKMAQSVDGKIADTSGRSKWITSGPSRKLVHKLRSRNDAVMIGVNTLIKDDPLLTCRVEARNRKQPMRVILDTGLHIPLYSRILNKGNGPGGKVLIIAGKGASPKKKASLQKKGAEVVLLPRRNNRVSLTHLMKYLAARDVLSVICEGGGELSASLLRDKLADEVLFFIAPRIIGGRTAPTSCGGTSSDIRRSVKLKGVKVKKMGDDFLMRGAV